MTKFHRLVCSLCFVLSFNAYATDSYDHVNNQLSISAVVLGKVVYRDVVITVGHVLTVGGSSGDGRYPAKPQNAFNTYDPVTNQLSIANVNAFGLIYHDVIVTVDKVLIVGSSSPLMIDNASLDNVASQSVDSHTLLQRIKNAIAAVTAASVNGP